MIGNDIRGEVELELNGQTFVLRPSYAAIRAIERQTGHPLVPLAAAADASSLTQEALAIIVTEMIRAWGGSLEVTEQSPPDEKALATSARGANVTAIGELIYAAGAMSVLPRIAVILGIAASGGCLPSGELKPTTGTMTSEIPGVGLAE